MRRSGFSLLEMIIALSISLLAVIAMLDLTTMLLTAQISGQHGLGAQGDALLVLKSLQADIRPATHIESPSPLGIADSLSGCVNDDPQKGAGAAGILVAGQTNWSFYYCVSGGTMYRYVSSGPSALCPMAPPACGTSGALTLSAQIAHSAGHGAFFSRQGGGNTIGIDYQTGSSSPQSVDTSIAFLESSP